MTASPPVIGNETAPPLTVAVPVTPGVTPRLVSAAAVAELRSNVVVPVTLGISATLPV